MRDVDRSEIAPALPARLQRLLACPACRGRLAEGQAALACAACGRAYPVEGGVPQLLDGLAEAERRQQERHDALYGADAYERYFQRPVFSMVLDRYVRPAFAGRVERLLELGCGRGQLGAWLERQAAHVIGIDLSAEGLRAAQLAAEGRACDYVQASARRLPLAEDSIDIVFCHFLLHHLETLGPSLAEIHRVLRPGGRLIAWEPAPRVPWAEVWLQLSHVPAAVAAPVRRAYAGAQRRWARDDGFGRAPDDGVHFHRTAQQYAEAAAAAGFTATAQTRVLECVPPRFLESSARRAVRAQLAASDVLMRNVRRARGLGKFILLVAEC